MSSATISKGGNPMRSRGQSRVNRKSHPPARLANARVKAPTMKKIPEVPAQRVLTSLRSRFNPIRILTPELLSLWLDSFKIGYIRECALVWDAIEDRDDKVKLVKPLRDKSVARYGYQIEIIPNLPEGKQQQAQQHQAALQSFYDRATCTSAIDENIKRGVEMLVRQMMDAVGKKYSVHEIIWQPGPDGLTAQFRWVPLWFFENTTGKLRYLVDEGQAEGQDLEDGGWMVTVGEGLMFATSIAYLFKTLPLRDWVTVAERNGMSIYLGRTSAPAGSAEYEAFVSMVGNISSDFAAVISMSEELEALDTKGLTSAEIYEKLVDRMDRSVASLWRGGDLSTMSSAKGSQGHGSDRQEDEKAVIIEDDAKMINETLRFNVDKYVIEYLFGDDQPLARFALTMPPPQATAQDIAVDEFLVGSGVPLGRADAYTRYNRRPPKEGEPILQAPPTPEQIPPGLDNVKRFANAAPTRHDAVLARLVANATPEIAAALAQTFRPFTAHLRNAVAVPDGQLIGSLTRFRAAMPDLLREMNVKPELLAPLSNLYATSLLNGLNTRTPASK